MKVYLPNPKFIFSVLIHAVIYCWDVKLWGVTVITVAAYPQTITLPATINTYLSGSATPWTTDIPNIVVVPYLCNATSSSVDIILDYEVGSQVPDNVPVIYIALAK